MKLNKLVKNLTKAGCTASQICIVVDFFEKTPPRAKDEQHDNSINVTSVTGQMSQRERDRIRQRSYRKNRKNIEKSIIVSQNDVTPNVTQKTENSITHIDRAHAPDSLFLPLIEERKKVSKSPPIPPNSDFENFFWEAYPKQRAGSKQKALAAWRTATTRSSKEEIYEAVIRYAGSDEVKRGFAKGAAAWLNDDRWTHDYDIKPNGHAGGRPGNGELALQAANEALAELGVPPISR